MNDMELAVRVSAFKLARRGRRLVVSSVLTWLGCLLALLLTGSGVFLLGMGLAVVACPVGLFSMTCWTVVPTALNILKMKRGIE